MPAFFRTDVENPSISRQCATERRSGTDNAEVRWVSGGGCGAGLGASDGPRFAQSGPTFRRCGRGMGGGNGAGGWRQSGQTWGPSVVPVERYDRTGHCALAGEISPQARRRRRRSSRCSNGRASRPGGVYRRAECGVRDTDTRPARRPCGVRNAALHCCGFSRSSGRNLQRMPGVRVEDHFVSMEPLMGWRRRCPFKSS